MTTLITPRLRHQADVHVRLHERSAWSTHLVRWQDYVRQRVSTAPLSLDPGWLPILEKGLRHTGYVLEAVDGAQTCGLLFLAYVESRLFGRFLVSLPYLNYGGVLADDGTIAHRLIDGAIGLADELDVRYLELRNHQPFPHPALGEVRTDKVNMHLGLPGSSEELWNNLSAKVRNQVRKAEKTDLAAVWGGLELLGDFYRVFSRNMRDLGTPVYGKSLFRAILEQFPGNAEIGVIRHAAAPIAAGLLLHGCGLTEVPSASSLRRFNPLCANMLLYWSMLQRAIGRGQQVFDFGRSSKDSPTFRFKKQWGAEPVEAPWQYYTRRGQSDATRRDNPRYQRFIRIWQRLPVWLTRLIGPTIVRGIP